MMIAVMAWIDWRLACWSRSSFSPSRCSSSLGRQHCETRAALRVAWKQEGRVSSVLQESLTSVKLVQAYVREDHEDVWLAKESSKSLDAFLQAAKLQARLDPLITILTTLGTVAVTAYGVVLAVQQHITPGILLVFLSYQRSMQSPARQLAKLSYTVGKAQAGAERLDETVRVGPRSSRSRTPFPSRLLCGDVRFEHVSFGYQEGTEVLHDFNLDVAAGQSSRSSDQPEPGRQRSCR